MLDTCLVNSRVVEALYLSLDILNLLTIIIPMYLEFALMIDTG